MLVDLVSILLFFTLVILIGRMTKKRESSPNEYFLGGQSFKWAAVGLSLFATNTSSIQLVGQTGLAYKIGLAAGNPQLIGAFLLGFSAIFFIPLYLKLRLVTIPAFLEHRFGRRAKLLFSLVTISLGFWTIPCLLYAGAITILGAFNLPNQYLFPTCLALTLVVGTYSIFGGLRSVVFTDCIQGSAILIGCLCMLVFAFIEIGGWNGIQTKLPKEHFELLLPSDDESMPWSGVFSGLLVASLFFSAANMDTLQRVLGAKSVKDAQYGMFLGAGLKVLALFLVVLPGALASGLFPDIAPDAAFGTMIVELLPIGVSGIMVAALIAAVMSSIDSSMLSISTIVAVELYPAVKKDSSEKQRLVVGYTTSTILLVWSCFAAPFVQNYELIFLVLLKASALILMPTAICFVAGRFFRSINETACLTVMIIGYTIGSIYFALTTIPGLSGLLPEVIRVAHFYHVSAVLAVVYTVALFGLSQFGPKPSVENLACTQYTGYASSKAPLAMLCLTLFIISLYLVF